MQFKIARIYFAEQRTVESGEIIAERVIEYSSRFDSSNLRHSRINTGFNRNFRRYVVIGIIEISNNLALEGKSNNGLIAGGSDNCIFEIACFYYAKISGYTPLLNKYTCYRCRYVPLLP